MAISTYSHKKDIKDFCVHDYVKEFHSISFRT